MIKGYKESSEERLESTTGQFFNLKMPKKRSWSSKPGKSLPYEQEWNSQIILQNEALNTTNMTTEEFRISEDYIEQYDNIAEAFESVK